jgi:protein ImuA
MSHLSLRASRLAQLDAHLSAPLRERLWQGDMLFAPASSVASGFAALDAQLPGGGWPARCLTELLIPAPGIGEMRLLAPCLAALVKAQRQIIVLASDEADHGLLYPDGWAQLGIDPRGLLLVRAERPADRLWAVEQSLRSAAFGALLAWLPEARADALRRLQLAAASAQGLSFLLRPAGAQAQSSPAPLRLLLARPPALQTQDRLLSIQLIKRRGPMQVQPLLLRLPEPRALHRPAAPATTPARTTRLAPASLTPAASWTVLNHALGRSALPDTAPRSHPAPAA